MSCDCQNQQDFCVSAGATFHPTVRWATDVLTSVPITGITQAAPPVITAAAHGVPNGWPVAVAAAGGMIQINATRYPPQGPDWQKSTVLSSNTLALSNVSAANYSAYTSGGFLVYNTPAVLTGVTATMTIWDNPDHTGTPLATLTSTGGQIAIDTTAMTLTPKLQTAGLTWTQGYYTFDVTDASGTVTELMRGTITIQ
ncbi:hypothetical protein [Burkholderia cenocepacia]|uniref:hypothetical protein n=1 Tax=Burkholderia cenocepacia TaxID=95486 RepID=UPI002650EF75|nr:hypothetical protein [Burkholderia cenocepacia]MDN7541948.1 hypothetical protein [Burkholderia cenocepacia]